MQNYKSNCHTMKGPLSSCNRYSTTNLLKTKRHCWRKSSQKQANDQVPVKALGGVQRDMTEELWRSNKTVIKNNNTEAITRTTPIQTSFKNRITSKTKIIIQKRNSFKRYNLLQILILYFTVPQKGPMVL